MASYSSASALRRGTVAGILSALCYSTAVVFVHYAYRSGLSPGTAIFLRFSIASLALAGLLLASRKWTRIPRARATPVVSLGLCTYTFMGIGWFTSLGLMPIWLVSLFVAMFPIPVTLGSWLLYHQRPLPQHLLSLAAVVGGGIALFWQPLGGAAWIGMLLMTGVIVMNSAYVLVGQRWTRRLHPGMTTFYTALGASIGTLLYAIISGQLQFAFDPAGWIWAALFAVVSTAAAIALLWESIKWIGASRASIIGSLEPLFSVLWSIVLLGEKMTSLQVLGGSLIVVGVLLVQWFPERGNEASPGQ